MSVKSKILSYFSICQSHLIWGISYKHRYLAIPHTASHSIFLNQSQVWRIWFTCVYCKIETFTFISAVGQDVTEILSLISQCILWRSLRTSSEYCRHSCGGHVYNVDGRFPAGYDIMSHSTWVLLSRWVLIYWLLVTSGNGHNNTCNTPISPLRI